MLQELDKSLEKTISGNAEFIFYFIQTFMYNISSFSVSWDICGSARGIIFVISNGPIALVYCVIS